MPTHPLDAIRGQRHVAPDDRHNGNWATNSITSTATSQFVSTEFTNVTANASGQIFIRQRPERKRDHGQRLPVAFPCPEHSHGSSHFTEHQHGGHAKFHARFCRRGPCQRELGGLTLAGTVTARLWPLAAACSLTATSSVRPTPGSRSLRRGPCPTLSLAGTTNIQNINAANSTTLTLPALSISATLVNVGNTSLYNGNVNFTGAVALTGASPVVNISAGTATLSSTLSGGAGDNVIVNGPATLAGGPSAAISALVTVNSNAVLIPDASQGTACSSAATSRSMGTLLSSGRITVPAMGTIALGSHTLTLSASNGSQGYPIFRPVGAAALNYSS